MPQQLARRRGFGDQPGNLVDPPRSDEKYLGRPGARPALDRQEPKLLQRPYMAKRAGPDLGKLLNVRLDLLRHLEPQLARRLLHAAGLLAYVIVRIGQDLRAESDELPIRRQADRAVA